MRSATFVVSIYNYHREVQPVVREFVTAGWRVGVVIGWIGSSADAAAELYEAMGCVVNRLPRGIAYPDNVEAPRRSTDSVPARPSSLARIVFCARNCVFLRRLKRRIGSLVDELRPDVILSGPFHSC